MPKRLLTSLLALLLFLASAVHAAPTHCDVCGNRLARQFLEFDGHSCCSQDCVDELRPHCSVCGNAIRGGYRKADGKVFCGEACYLTTRPKCELCKEPVRNGYTVAKHHYCGTCMETHPTCFSCGLPARYPTQLEDGRDICINCMRWAVKSQSMAEKHYELARRQLEAWTGLKLETVPELVLVDKSEMMQRSKKLRKTDASVSVRGLYSRQTLMMKGGLFGKWRKAPELDEEQIYIVDHLHDAVFRVAATHELMHDLIHEYFPQLEDAPLWVHEGICQQAAAEYCLRRNHADILHGIEHCEDPDYGDGYRYINSLMGFEGWPALRRWLETVDVESLPKKAPKEGTY